MLKTSISADGGLGCSFYISNSFWWKCFVTCVSNYPFYVLIIIIMARVLEFEVISYVFDVW